MTAPSPLVNVKDLVAVISRMSDEQRSEFVASVASAAPIWVPQPGPQTVAFESKADIVYYGGSAGGGKSDLLLGLALTEHVHSIIYRRQSTQLIGIQKRLLDEILKSRKGWNGQTDILSLPGRAIEFGSCNNLGDEVKYQGRPHDLVCFDELAHFAEAQFRFLMGWLRTTIPGQRCRVVCSGNPPTNTEGQWVTRFFAPWLDDKHPNPAKPGELRWYTTIEQKDIACESGIPFKLNGKTVTPISRTFIPSRVSDNVFLAETGYEATLQALPEPLRSQMLDGDFKAGMEDSAWQVVPTAWIDAAMARWKPEGRCGEMTSAGGDVSRGGRDKTILASRYEAWYDELKTWPGSQVPDGATAAGLFVSCLRDGAPIHVDGLGVGGECVGWLQSNNVHCESILGNETRSVEGQYDKATGQLKFRNLRAMLYWRFRESLDPKTGDHVCLPSDPELKADLCAVMWKLTPGGILIEDKEEIKKRIGRSPDKGDAVIYCSVTTPKKQAMQQHFRARTDYDPFTYDDPLGGADRQVTDYNVFER